MRIVTVLITLALTLFSMQAVASTQSPKVPALTEQQKSDVKRVQAYLNGLSTMVSTFTQFAPDGTMSKGTFYLSRPGKVRWQYDPPTPILIVAKGSLVTYYDYELEQISYVSVDDALSGFLTQQQINFFADNIAITQVSKDAGIIRISLIQRKKPEEGALTLLFSEAPLELKKMEVTDTLNQLTHVTFSDSHYGVLLENKLFVVPHPRYGGKR